MTEEEGGDLLVALAYVKAILPRECSLDNLFWSYSDYNEVSYYRCHGGYYYSSLKLLNILLKTIPEPLQLELVSDEGGEGGLVAKLIVRPLRCGREHNQLASLENNDHRVLWQNIPQDFAICDGQNEGQVAVKQEQDLEEHPLQNISSEVAYDDDRLVPSTPETPKSAQQHLHESNHNPCSTPSSARLNKERRRLLTQLRELDLTNRSTLKQLLDNTFPPALSKLHVRTPEGLIHLATLAGTGQVYSVRIFKHSYALHDDLSFASLHYAAVAAGNNTNNQRRLTPYQIFEMAQILKAVSRKSYGGLFWASFEAMWPAEWPAFKRCIKEPVDMSAISWRLHHHRDFYKTLGELKCDVDRLYNNAERFWGQWDERTAAAQMTVEEIYRLMGESCAVGPRDIDEKMFYHGLVREVYFPASVGTENNHPGGSSAEHAPPRCVLPLGSLYVADDYTQEPKATSSFVLMDITTPRKALWLVEYREDHCRLVMLAPDVGCWRLADEGRVAIGHDGSDAAAGADVNIMNVGGLLGRNQQPSNGAVGAGAGDGAVIPKRNTLTEEYPETQITTPAGAILFRRPNRELALRAINAGWAVRR